MLVYVFNSTQNPKLYGFTADATDESAQRKRPLEILFKSLKMNAGEKGRIGVDTDAVLMGISDRGYYLSAAELKFED